MNRARVLCVDDEPHVLEALQRVLRASFDVSTAIGGTAALQLLRAGAQFDVIVSDMRMPEMNGAQLLSEVRQLAPDTVRILLTGQADLDAAVAAVNEGHIFRFLTKPCAPESLTIALRAAALQHRLLTAERVLLAQTLVGAARALSEALALSHPEAFGPASRQHERARLVAETLGVLDAWHVEVASILASLGYVVLPAEVLSKWMLDEPLDDSERAMVKRIPSVVETVLSSIPRLEKVREVLKSLGTLERPADAPKPSNLGAPIGARILRALLDLGLAEARHGDTRQGLVEISARRDFYGSNVLDAVLAVCAPEASVIRALPIREIGIGMVLLEPLKSTTGMTVLARGQRVTPQLLERLKNYQVKLQLAEPVRCEVPSGSIR